MYPIELKGISKVYHPGQRWARTALHDIHLCIAEGEACALMGASGSGKTTLLKIIGQILAPTSGECRIHGVNTAALSERKKARIRNQTIGFIFQVADCEKKRAVKGAHEGDERQGAKGGQKIGQRPCRRNAQLVPVRQIGHPWRTHFNPEGVKAHPLHLNAAVSQRRQMPHLMEQGTKHHQGGVDGLVNGKKKSDQNQQPGADRDLSAPHDTTPS